MKFNFAAFFLLLNAGLSIAFAADVPSTRGPVQAPIKALPVPAVAGPRTVPNTIDTVELYMKNASVGTIVRFKIGGVSTNTNAKCVVQVNFDRAANAINPMPFSMTKEYTLASIPTTLETESMNKGGDWTFKIKPVRECTGKENVFNFKIAFSAQESEPVIYGVGIGAASISMGMSGQITIVGGGDLKDCKVELNSFGLMIAGPLTATGSKIISMNGQLNYQEPYTLPLPPNYVKTGQSTLGKVWVKAVSGCTVKAPDMEGKQTVTFMVFG